MRVLSVFSTYVEVILVLIVHLFSIMCFLHVCGGDPQIGCAFVIITKVFSTYVEVILRGLVVQGFLSGFLHVCGGDPTISY